MVTPTLIYDCPHALCGARHQAFTCVSGYTVRAPKRVPATVRHGTATVIAGTDIVIFSCVRCSYPVVAEVARNGAEPAYSVALQLHENFKGEGYKLLRLYPVASNPEDLPDHVPEVAGAPYGQACRALHSRDYDLAGMGFRKSLDVATKYVIRAAEGANAVILKQSFQKRINFLRDRQLITADLKDWADLVRVEGNDAAHDEEPFTSEQAHQIHSFARIFLMYVFTMPKMVEIFRAEPTEPSEVE